MTLEEVMHEHPFLTYAGMVCNQRDATYIEKRRELEEDAETFARVVEVFATLRHIKGFTYTSSYGIKHLMENYLGESVGGYVSNGTCIAAAMACGFKTKLASPGSLNVYFNVSKRELKALQIASWKQRKQFIAV